MEVLPANLAERLRELTYNEREVAYLQVDAALTLVGAGGHLDNYGLAAMRLGESAVEQAFFLEGLLPLEESLFSVPSIELDCGRAADFISIATATPRGWCCSTSLTTATLPAGCSRRPMR